MRRGNADACSGQCGEALTKVNFAALCVTGTCISLVDQKRTQQMQQISRGTAGQGRLDTGSLHFSRQTCVRVKLQLAAGEDNNIAVLIHEKCATKGCALSLHPGVQHSPTPDVDSSPISGKTGQPIESLHRI